MSSRKLQKNSKSESEEDDDLFNASQFPSGGGRVVGIRDEDDIQQVEENLRRVLDNKPDFGLNKPRQEQFDLDESGKPEDPIKSKPDQPQRPNNQRPAGHHRNSSRGARKCPLLWPMPGGAKCRAGHAWHAWHVGRTVLK